MAGFWLHCAVGVTLVLLCMTVFAPLAFANQIDAKVVIASAKQQIVTCFEAARAAEVAGVNVTSLNSVLDDAGLLFSEAELAYSQGDYDSAQNLALQCKNGLGSFVSEANALTVAAAEAKNSLFLANVAGSASGIFIVVVAAVALWFFVKRHYEPDPSRVELEED